MQHAIDPHKHIGIQPAPAQRKSFYFTKPSSNSLDYIQKADPIEIFIEIKYERKVFGKNDIEFKLYNQKVQE